MAKARGDNSDWSPVGNKGTDYSTKDGLYKSVIIITPNLDQIKESSKNDGVDFDEKLLQVMSVEKDHITDPAQIAKELKNPGFEDSKDPKVVEDIYSTILNTAIKVGKEYRNEKNIPIDESSNLPVTKVNKTNNSNIKITQ